MLKNKRLNIDVKKDRDFYEIISIFKGVKINHLQICEHHLYKDDYENLDNISILQLRINDRYQKHFPRNLPTMNDLLFLRISCEVKGGLIRYE